MQDQQQAEILHKKIKIGAKIGFPALVQASIDFELEKVPNGESKVKTTSKDSARIGSSGDSARIGSSGDSARIGSSGYYAQIGSSGDYAQIGSSGDSARITSKGNYSVICCAGNNSIAKGKKGSWITLAEWKFDKKENAYIPICVKTERIDGEKIKEDTFYKLKNGEFVECEG